MGTLNLETVRMFERELSLYDVRYDFEHGGKHPYLVISTSEGAVARVTYPSTPRTLSGTGLLNMRAELRRVLRRLGAKRHEPEALERRQSDHMGDHTGDRPGSVGDALVDKISMAGDEHDNTDIVIVSETRASDLVKSDPEVQRLREELKNAMRVAKANAKPPTRTQTQPAKLPKTAKDTAIMSDIHSKSHFNDHSGDSSEASTEAQGRAPWQVLSRPEVAKVTRLIITNADIDDTKQTVRYHNGWDDERILNILKADPERKHLNIKQIAQLRRETFGKTEDEIKVHPRGEALRSLWAARKVAERVDELERRVFALEEKVSDPNSKY